MSLADYYIVIRVLSETANCSILGWLFLISFTLVNLVFCSKSPASLYLIDSFPRLIPPIFGFGLKSGAAEGILLSGPLVADMAREAKLPLDRVAPRDTVLTFGTPS